MKRIIGLALLLLVLYLLFWPIDLQPEKWDPPKPPALESEYAVNELLKGVERKFEGICLQCEDVAIDKDHLEVTALRQVDGVRWTEDLRPNGRGDALGHGLDVLLPHPPPLPDPQLRHGAPKPL